jgi:hypothetical protein
VISVHTDLFPANSTNLSPTNKECASTASNKECALEALQSVVFFYSALEDL